MIRHIIKIIWNERKINIWIFLEYILVFTILWFCTDFLFYMTKIYIEPPGLNIERVYKLNMGNRSVDLLTGRQKEEAKDMRTELQIIAERLKRYPGITAVSFSNHSIPYNPYIHSITMGFENDSILSGKGYPHYVSSEYFDVFKINVQKEKMRDWNNPGGQKKVWISPDFKNEIFNRPANRISSIVIKNSGLNETGNEDQNIYEVIGITGKIKTRDYERYSNIVYLPYHTDIHNGNFLPEICFRVDAQADKNFIGRFTKDMRPQLDIGKRYLQNIQPLNNYRKKTNKNTDNTLRSVYSVTGFLIINIFLGIAGTFWIRTYARRSQIGLRIALGATKRKVQTMLVTEAILLLFSASIISVIICLNVGETDLLMNIGVPRIDREENRIGLWQDAINYAITFIFLAAVSLLAAWYPANRAANMQPAVVLRDE